MYLNARVSSALVGGAPRAVLASLGQACDAGLARTDDASPDDLAGAVAPCLRGAAWSECRTDVPPGGYGVCPNDASAWLQRHQRVYDHWVALNGELSLDSVSFAPAALSSTMADGVNAGQQKPLQALQMANPLFDFRIVDYLAAFKVDSYRGTGLIDALHGFAKSPGYALSATDIASTALWLNQDGAVSGADTVSFLKALASDDQVDIGTKLYIEDALYRSGALD